MSDEDINEIAALDATDQNDPFADDPIVAPKIQNHDKFEIIEIAEGSGPEVISGDYITIHYNGTLIDGTKFDSSYDRGAPFRTRIGVGNVIAGWEMGIPGMKVGGKRKLIIPAQLAYGDREIGQIPAGSTLIFEVELMGIE